jgi:hypothetical protein
MSSPEIENYDLSVESDLAGLLLRQLQSTTRAEAIAVHDLVVNGPAGILEAGDITRARLERLAAERAVASPNGYDKVLAISVQDDGEEVIDSFFTQQRAVIRIYDRLRGNRNTRKVRHRIKHALRGYYETLYAYDGRQEGLLAVDYAGSSGHRIDIDFAVEYEALTFVGLVQSQGI